MPVPGKFFVAEVAMGVTWWVVTAVSAGLSAVTIGIGVADAAPSAPPSAPVLVSPPTGLGFWWEWDDDDDDWSQVVTWDCPAGCSITWEDNP